MCDIYTGYCSICKDPIKPEIHLNGFDTERSEIIIFCERHIPDKDVVVFEKNDVTKKHCDPHTPRKYKFGMRSLTPNAYENRYVNCPNDSGYKTTHIGMDGEIIEEFEW